MASLLWSLCAWSGRGRMIQGIAFSLAWRVLRSRCSSVGSRSLVAFSKRAVLAAALWRSLHTHSNIHTWFVVLSHKRSPMEWRLSSRRRPQVTPSRAVSRRRYAQVDRSECVGACARWSLDGRLSPCTVAQLYRVAKADPPLVVGTALTLCRSLARANSAIIQAYPPGE